MARKTELMKAATALATAIALVGCLSLGVERIGRPNSKKGVVVAPAEPAPAPNSRKELAVAPAEPAPAPSENDVAAAAPAPHAGYVESASRSLAYMGGGSPRRSPTMSVPQSPRLRDDAMAPRYVAPAFNTEQYDHAEIGGFLLATRRPLSTFSVDVDTASYSNVRRFLNQGVLPPPGAVRVEEMVNYFSYDYPRDPEGQPFTVVTELVRAPWDSRHQLLMIGLQGKELSAENVPPRNLVFLIDVSGSMMPENKLALLKRGLRALVERLRPQDRVALAVYAGASGLVLPPTSGANQERILEALDRLEAGGSTNGGEGLQLAYATAREHFDKGGINRVILATDGDFNVGTTSRSDLVGMIEKERQSGVFLTVLGVGTGNLKDATMEELADHGNGNYAYLDTISEARKVLVEEAGGTLVTIAKDVKIQVEFNPSRVSAYRLIGYENRRLEDKDFNDDSKDAGEIGAGHSVTALYEIVPVGESVEGIDIDPLRYQQPREPAAAAHSDELVTVKLRYKQPDGDDSRLLSTVVRTAEVGDGNGSDNIRFAAAVAAFGMVLRESAYRGNATLAMSAKLGRGALGKDPHAYRAEFLRLVAVAEGIGAGG